MKLTFSALAVAASLLCAAATAQPVFVKGIAIPGQAWSPLVCLEPGSMTQSAPAKSAGLRAQTRRTPGSVLSG